MRAVLDWAAERDPDRGLRLAALLEAFWVVRDPIEGAAWLERLLARAPDAEPKLRAHALRALGGTLDIFGEPERAAPCYQQSLELFNSSGDEIQAAHLRTPRRREHGDEGRDGRRLAATRGLAP